MKKVAKLKERAMMRVEGEGVKSKERESSLVMRCGVMRCDMA